MKNSIAKVFILVGVLALANVCSTAQDDFAMKADLVLSGNPSNAAPQGPPKSDTAKATTKSSKKQADEPKAPASDAEAPSKKKKKKDKKSGKKHKKDKTTESPGDAIGEFGSDYCAEDLCVKGKKHIGCGNSGDFHFNCPKNRTLIELNEDNIEQILDTHNKYRNRVASGNEPRFESAARMTTMTWDEELAYLATLNVKQCEMRHDDCRGTDKFKFAGQNLCIRKKSQEFENLDDAINNCINTWYGENESSSMSDINKCCNLESVKPIGHFTAMVNDRAHKVGCALIRFRKKGKIQTLMACNYSNTNMLDRTVYTTGKAASGCSAGTNQDYEALCSEEEEVNPNEIF